VFTISMYIFDNMPKRVTPVPTKIKTVMTYNLIVFYSNTLFCYVYVFIEKYYQMFYILINRIIFFGKKAVASYLFPIRTFYICNIKLHYTNVIICSIINPNAHLISYDIFKHHHRKLGHFLNGILNIYLKIRSFKNVSVYF